MESEGYQYRQCPNCASSYCQGAHGGQCESGHQYENQCPSCASSYCQGSHGDPCDYDWDPDDGDY